MQFGLDCLVFRFIQFSEFVIFELLYLPSLGQQRIGERQESEKWRAPSSTREKENEFSILLSTMMDESLSGQNSTTLEILESRSVSLR